MAENLYQYAVPRGDAQEREIIKSGKKLHGSVKEAAVNLVRSGEKATLEDALEHMGYSRKVAHRIFEDSCRIEQQILAVPLIVRDVPLTGFPICNNIPQPPRVPGSELLASHSANVSVLRAYGGNLDFILPSLLRPGSARWRQSHKEEGAVLCGVVSRISGGHILAIPGDWPNLAFNSTKFQLASAACRWLALP